MKKSKLIISIILLLSVLAVSSIMFISSADSAAPDPGGYTGDSSTDVGRINDLGNQVITVVSTIGSVVSVIVLVILGLKYMMGSAEEKAEYKKTLLPYVIGAALVFAASTIAGIVFSISQNI